MIIKRFSFYRERIGWNVEWNVLKKELPRVEHFTSGIKYSNKGKNLRDSLMNVYKKQKKVISVILFKV